MGFDLRTLTEIQPIIYTHNMKKTLIAVALLPLCAAAYAQNPKAADEAVVIRGNARFTVLTDRMIRMEWTEDGQFEDRASLAIINRNLDVPAFKVSKAGDKTVIRTSAVTKGTVTTISIPECSPGEKSVVTVELK